MKGEWNSPPFVANVQLISVPLTVGIVFHPHGANSTPRQHLESLALMGVTARSCAHVKNIAKVLDFRFSRMKRVKFLRCLKHEFKS